MNEIIGCRKVIGHGETCSSQPMLCNDCAFREKLANLCHEQWGGWMQYLFSKCHDDETPTGDMIIPSWAVKRWKKQIDTDYQDLSNEEQDSDRVEADKFIKLIEEKP